MLTVRTPSAVPGLLWLAIGTALLLLAVHGRWDVPVAAWLCGIFLLRYTRTTGPLAGLVGVGLATAAGTVFWLGESGRLVPFGPAVPLSVVLGSALAVPFLADRLIVPRLAHRPVVASLVFPAARVGVEYLIATVSPVGAILGSLAATQTADLPLLQLAALTGSWGISFLVAWLAAVVNLCWACGWGGARVRTVAVTFGLVVVLVLGGGGLRLASAPAAQATVRVAAVAPQRSLLDARDDLAGSFPSARARAQADPAGLRAVFAAANADLLAESERQARAGAELVVWPEVGAAALEADLPELLGQVSALADRSDTYVLAGLAVVGEAPPYARNQALLFGPDGELYWTYDKARPVPGMEQLQPGAGVVPTVETPFGTLGAVICFDADFPALMRAPVDIMLVPSNDWPEFAEPHAEKATLRAVEYGYALVRPATHGTPRVVDGYGRVLAAAGWVGADRQVMVAEVPVAGIRTVYGVVGDLFAGLCLVFLAGSAGFAVRAARRRPTRAGG